MTALPGTQNDAGHRPSAPPTAVGYLLRVLVWLLFVAITAALLIPLMRGIGYAGVAVGLVLAGIARAVLKIGDSWLDIVAIPVALGMVLSLVLAPAMLTLATGDRVPFVVGEFTDTGRCTLKEAGDSTRVVEDMPCNDGPGRNWQEGSEVEVYLDGVMTKTRADGTPWEADALERNFNWVLPLFVTSVLGGLAIRTVKVHRHYWRRTP